ncbi:ankyrin repeat domain-containing protein [Actinoplanes sp. L3-i22]|uniref:ankyrin repeat domain-containing protein n=1 Tax=Actinoplanes sp. L3-i22 TaxID=2836373 RepID=UPI001C7836D5|nr:ankyrin repeat domain-containing protein [Actinoplanes sp. L3-i22]BCY06147.1 hypothetical protein L3i22_012350 [Actinoplanes sp. L3-i22]
MSGHDRLALAEWQRIRRYAVPARMIEECAAARARGDWAAACAAGEVDVTFDAESLTTRHGPAVTAVLLEMLAGFAPDLLRWHLPRALGGHTTLATGKDYILAPDGPVEQDTVVLVVRSPVSVLGSQRLTLSASRLGDLLTEADPRESPPQPIRLAPHHWDARRAGELRAAAGGSAERLPGFTPAGDPLPAAALGAGNDAPARVERALLAGQPFAGWHEAGLRLPPDDFPVQADPRSSDPRSPESAVDRRIDPVEARWIDPWAVAAEARRVAARFGHRTLALWFSYDRLLRLDVDADTVRVTPVTVVWRRNDEMRRLPVLSLEMLGYPVDLELVRSGRLPAGALHPLVRAALFPAAPPAPVAPPPDPAPIRVRCRGEWHPVEHRAGQLRLPLHTADEEQRERALRAFGGTVTGCFAAAQTWTGASGRLPRRLRAHRDDLWLRMLHGGTRTVLELLDAGMDPRIRDGRGRTLLHQVRAFDHARLLPRLLAAGLDVNARDKEGSTPLYLAVVHVWPAGLITALVDAGADPHTPNQDDQSVLGYIDEYLEFFAFEEYDGDDAPEYESIRGPEFRAAIDYLKERA